MATALTRTRTRTRWSALAASALIQCFAGSSYCFGVYSPALKASQGYDQSALDAVAFFKDVGANAGVPSGFLAAWAPAGRRRPWLVLLAGAALCAVGYLPMWLAVAGIVPAPLPLMCVYMLLAAQAQTFFNTADVVTAVENFPGRRGTVIGIMKGFLGLSGAILVQIYHTLHIDPSTFILMLAALPTAITLMLMYFVDVHNTHERYSKKFLDAFSLIAVTVAGYLMAFIICDQVFIISSAVQSVCSVILLLLLLSPVAVVVMAQKSEPIQHEESTSEQRIRLLQEEDAEDSVSARSTTAPGGSNQYLSDGKENLNLLQAMCKLNFWLLFLSMACGMGSGLATVNNISQIGGSLGYTTKETSTLVSLWSIWNFSGRFGAGFISDHFLRLRGVGRPFFIGVTLLIMSVGHAIISSGLPTSLYIGSVLVGLCYGCQWALMPSITSEIFGLNHFGTIFNMVAVASPVGSYILSVRVVGYIYDMESPPDEHACLGNHCFALSFMIMAGVCVFGSAVAFVLFIRTRKFYRRVVYASLQSFLEK
ncbi:protein NUCLEAR FUSION DEFECTIVE 4-like [Phragmites australis]|uniref:protein NUCLEAR FUSION DEFECTIVE 4-like n=1 Tax=Phragmites australis TaxID=29695 RepID=UPI002D79A635|nr:protein NUCLEAR FUSION DEFECTIVE 4-like [Phragmites australis]